MQDRFGLSQLTSNKRLRVVGVVTRILLIVVGSLTLKVETGIERMKLWLKNQMDDVGFKRKDLELRGAGDYLIEHQDFLHFKSRGYLWWFLERLVGSLGKNNRTG